MMGGRVGRGPGEVPFTECCCVLDADTCRVAGMDRVEHDLSDDQWTALNVAWGGCAYCGATDRPLQRDCVLALSRGGRYTLDNIVPACRSCNTSKCNDEVTSWLRREHLDERALLLCVIATSRRRSGSEYPTAPTCRRRPPVDG
jgi:hypothetical protein